MGKITEISRKTSNTAWQWAEANHDNEPLADAYVGACLAISMCNRNDIAKRLGITEAKASEIDAHAFQYRNALAREIVKMLKRELPNALNSADAACGGRLE